ncbi:MAG: stage V sporulation protein AC [Ruminococcaceae bacterium]|nr:stage V sporulation protein AC [Oscillospiraceae bacterium]
MITKNIYNEYLKKKTPNSPTFKNCIRAFMVGGIICAVGQGITDILTYFGLGLSETKILTPIILIVIGGILTALGIYDKLGKYAGGGTIIPITGFSNSIISSAIEFRKEGFILGVGAKMFTIAGPVIVYGTVASVVYGLIYWITTLF